MDISKIAGWVVFAGGIFIIGWTLLTSYNIFTKQAEVPEFFGSSSQVQELASGEGFQEQLENLAREELRNIIPTDSITTFLNLGVWSAFAFIFIFGGFHLANLGIKLIRKGSA